MADNSWMLPPKIRYKKRKFGTKEAEMLMMCNRRSQEAELQRRYQRLNVALQDFLRKYRHEVWEVRHFLRNIGRIQQRQDRGILLPTEKYEEEIFNAKLKAYNLKKKKQQQGLQESDIPYAYIDTDDEAVGYRLADMVDRSLSLTPSTMTNPRSRNKSVVTFEDPSDDDLEPDVLPELNKRSQQTPNQHTPTESSSKKRRKKSDIGSKGPALTTSTVRKRTPTNLDPIMEDSPLRRPIIVPSGRDITTRKHIGQSRLPAISHEDAVSADGITTLEYDKSGPRLPQI